jgi:hypothetical protein
MNDYTVSARSVKTGVVRFRTTLAAATSAEAIATVRADYEEKNGTAAGTDLDFEAKPKCDWKPDPLD